MAKWKRKPYVVEAMKWTGDNYDEIKEFGKEDIRKYNGCVFYDTPETNGILNRGEIVIKHYFDDHSVAGLEVMPEEQFLALYEPV